MIKNILIVGMGGFAGSVFRYLVYLLSVSDAETKTLFPWGTFWVNIMGCFLIGLFWGMMDTYEWFSEELRLLLMVGFCGGFTTFSSYALDSIIIGKNDLILTLIYLFFSIIIGLLLLYLGHYFIRTIIS